MTSNARLGLLPVGGRETKRPDYRRDGAGASHLAASFLCKCTAVGKVQPRDKHGKAGSPLPPAPASSVSGTGETP